MRLIDRVRLFRGNLLLGSLAFIQPLAASIGLRGAYRALLIHLIKKTELFDRSYYLEHHPDVAESGMLPLRHYVAYGDGEGRAPHAFFDPVYYRAHMPGAAKRVNALLHYFHVGRHKRISPSPWFDVDFYLNENKDVARSGMDPLCHYLKWGGIEGRSPSADFDGAFYLRSNPEVMQARMNPLLHYLVGGRIQGRPTRGDQDGECWNGCEELPLPRIPDPDSWAGLVPRARVAGTRAHVDVLVPVYGGRAQTLACLHSVLTARSETPFELIVINDASPDRELAAELERLAGLGLFSLLTNPENRGFVWTVNRGMRLHRGRDVLLLNADTEVYDGCLDRLRAAAYRRRRTGTVTPLSNNATICSYPRFLHDNPYPLELPYSELDALAARANRGREVVAPTGVGFCMYIKRACIAEVGFFNEKAFGKGYGEENDFCQRALRRAWRNIIAADVFVRHWGSASFQGEKAKRVKAAMRVMDRRHPGYRSAVAAFIQRDPLAKLRARLDWARLLRLRRERNVLIVCHNRGGGTERHVQEDMERMTAEGLGVFVLRPAREDQEHVFIGSPRLRSAPNLSSLPLRGTERLDQQLSALGISEIHTHSLVDFTPDSPTHIRRLVEDLRARWEVNLHDYKVICPRVNLADEHGRYCGEPDEAACNHCLAVRGSDFHVRDIRAWRDLHHAALGSADAVLVPDEDVRLRLQRYYPDVAISVSPHEEIRPARLSTYGAGKNEGGVSRIVVIGAIGKLKGYDVLLACARDAKARDLPLEFVLMGYSMNDRLLAEAGIRITGKYQEHEAVGSLVALEPDLIWLPSLWPETYSYTLSIALHAGRPIAAFDIGAIASRLRQFRRAEMLMDLQLADSPGLLNETFMQHFWSVRTDHLRAVS